LAALVLAVKLNSLEYWMRVFLFEALYTGAQQHKMDLAETTRPRFSAAASQALEN
jgi:hypothetical protein